VEEKEDSMQSPFLTADEVALLLRKSTKWVYQRAGDIPGAFKLGGSWFFDKDILLSSLKELAAPGKPKRNGHARVDALRHGLS